MNGREKQRISPLSIVVGVLIAAVIMKLNSQNLAVYAQDEITADDRAATVLELPFSATGLERILDAFRVREADLTAAEAQLDQRRASLVQAQRDIESRISELQQIEKSLEATLALSNIGAEDDINQLASVYENMKPEDAAKVFSIMTPNFAAGFLGRMQPDAAAAILADLDPEVGHTISVVFAGRNAKDPEATPYQ